MSFGPGPNLAGGLVNNSVGLTLPLDSNYGGLRGAEQSPCNNPDPDNSPPPGDAPPAPYNPTSPIFTITVSAFDQANSNDVGGLYATCLDTDISVQIKLCAEPDAPFFFDVDGTYSFMTVGGIGADCNNGLYYDYSSGEGFATVGPPPVDIVDCIIDVSRISP